MSSESNRQEVSRTARLAAPLAAFVGTTLARRFLETRYRKATGAPTPAPEDLQTAFARVLAWSVLTAVVSTVIEVSIVRAIDRAGAREPSRDGD